MHNPLSMGRRSVKSVVSRPGPEVDQKEAALLAFTGTIGTTCDLGVQSVTLAPGASCCCGSGCCCSSCCSW